MFTACQSEHTCLCASRHFTKLTIIFVICSCFVICNIVVNFIFCVLLKCVKNAENFCSSNGLYMLALETLFALGGRSHTRTNEKDNQLITQNLVCFKAYFQFRLLCYGLS